MNKEIRIELRETILEYLRPHLQKCAKSYISGDMDLIELNILETAEVVSERVVIRVGILDDSTQIHIPNISFPPSWRGNHDGMRLIDAIYQTAKKHRYALFVIQCTEGFYNYLLSTCGASRTDEDSVEITDQTRLVNEGRLAARKFGYGYKSSYDAAIGFDEMSAFGFYPDIKIVHGRITPLAGIDKGNEIQHAWVEMGEQVVETSNGQEERYVTSKFYRRLHAARDHVYSVQEAKAHVENSGTYGPWV